MSPAWIILDTPSFSSSASTASSAGRLACTSEIRASLREGIGENIASIVYRDCQRTQTGGPSIFLLTSLRWFGLQKKNTPAPIPASGLRSRSTARVHQKFLRRDAHYAACPSIRSRSVDRPIIAAFRAADLGSNPGGSIILYLAKRSFEGMVFAGYLPLLKAILSLPFFSLFFMELHRVSWQFRCMPSFSVA
jgi:hypothetical protein